LAVDVTIDQTEGVEPGPDTELSSIASQIDDLAGRVGALLENLSDCNRVDGQSPLLEVERHLLSAHRELERLIR